MTTLKENWIQDVAESIRIPAVSPMVARTLLPVIELQIRKIAQQAYKFYKRGKGQKLTVEDINLALSMNRVEEIYGLHSSDSQVPSSSSSSLSSTSQLVDPMTGMINIAALAKLPTLRCPILPDLTLHWLAVEGTQPLIPENPSFSNNSNYYDQPYDLPQEMQHFYSRITGAILTNDSSTLPAVYHSLQNDAGLQELLPYMSRFIYQQIKVNTKSLPLLLGLIKSLRSILYNRYLRAEFHIQQILPAIFTCIVAARLSSTYNEDHWQLRSIAAELISFICVKYSEQFPDLQARVCKTFIDALSDDKSLTAVYGGIVGLSSLGHTVIKSLLLPHIGRISNRISKQQIDNDIKKNLSNNNLEKINSKHNKKGNDLSGNEIIKDNIKYPTENEIASLKCREALLYSLGKYIITCMSMPVITTSLSDFTRNQNSNSISTTDNNKKKRIIEKKIDNNNDEEKISYLCDLEEELVPYYLLKSTQLPYCQYFI